MLHEGKTAFGAKRFETHTSLVEFGGKDRQLLGGAEEEERERGGVRLKVWSRWVSGRVEIKEKQ